MMLRLHLCFSVVAITVLVATNQHLCLYVTSDWAYSSSSSSQYLPKLRAFLPCNSVDLDVLLTNCLVQLPFHPIIGPKECEDQKNQEAKHDDAWCDNLVLVFLLQRYQVGPSADQCQPDSIQEKVAEGANLLFWNHDLESLFSLWKSELPSSFSSRKDSRIRSDLRSLS